MIPSDIETIISAPHAIGPELEVGVSNKSYTNVLEVYSIEST